MLRIEDTDQKRFVEGSTEKIFEALDWYGLTPDEGPQQGGQFAPYVQSERLDRYRQYAEQLVTNGKAYYCFCTPERLDQLRAAQTAAKQQPKYDKHCATLTSDEVATHKQAGETYTIRMKLPESGILVHHDIIRGTVKFQYNVLDDSVILKTDGYPTYHLANVVDDHDMGISHVIRAEEWLPSVPKHLFLYEAFGWTPPVFAHLPLLLGTDRAKLSKRHGATSALSFRDEGYLPEALTNFLALMGWHPKDEQEIFTREKLVEQFSLEGINPSGAVFDRTKLDWMNGMYIRALSVEQLLERLRPFWKLPDEKHEDSELLNIVRLIHDRLVRLTDINDFANFMFPSVWDTELPTIDRAIFVPKKGTIEATNHHLEQTAKWLSAYNGEWKSATLKEQMIAAIASMGKKNGEILWPLRAALSLRAASPDVFDLLEVLGKEESIRRIEHVCR